MHETMLELDGALIEAEADPLDVTHRFLRAVGARGTLAEAVATDLLATGENGWVNENSMAEDLALGSGATFWAELAEAVGHSTTGARFRWMATMMVDGAVARAEEPDVRVGAVAATVGFKLARHVAEADVVRSVAGWEVADVALEGEEIDLVGPDGQTAQVLASVTDNPDTARTKMSAGARDVVDYYVVAHLEAGPEGHVGVGVTDLQNDRDVAHSAGVRARDAGR